jgi:thioester reductase-like protein
MPMRRSPLLALGDSYGGLPVKRKTILLTGASGVVGTALLPRIAGHRVITLTHRRPAGTEQVRGDLAQPLLGIGAAAYGELVTSVDAVVHCAAVTDFGAGRSVTEKLNIEGTEQILRLAATADAQLIYVSTAFVSRTELTRQARGRQAGDATASPEHYLDSKRAAEQLIRDSGLPAVIARPSVVIGDSRTGEISQLQGLMATAYAIVKNVLPLVPLEATTRLDVIPQDAVAAALAALVNSDTQQGEYWLTAGPAALTAGRAVELCVQVAHQLGRAATPARLVDPAMVERLIRPVFIDPLPPTVRRKFDDVLAMAALFSGADPFPTSLGELPGCAELGLAEIEHAFVASLTYQAQVRGLAADAA